MSHTGHSAVVLLLREHACSDTINSFHSLVRHVRSGSRALAPVLVNSHAVAPTMVGPNYLANAVVSDNCLCLCAALCV